MENNFELYGALLDSASEAAEACLDMEGGAFFLAWSSELIRDLADKGYCRSACLTAQKLCEAVGIDWTWAECDELEPIEKIRYNKLRKRKKDKKRHSLQSQVEWSWETTFRKETASYVGENCTTKRGSNQGAAERIGARQRRRNAE